MANRNQVSILGNLGQAPKEIKCKNANIKMVELQVATNYENKDKNVKSKEWHRIIVFNKVAEVALKYLAKGHLVQVHGRIEYNVETVVTVKDGEEVERKFKHSRIVAHSIDLIQTKSTSDRSYQPPETEDEIPF